MPRKKPPPDLEIWDQALGPPTVPGRVFGPLLLSGPCTWAGPHCASRVRESLVVSPTSAVQQPFLWDPIPMVRTSSTARSQAMIVGGQGAQGRSPDTPRASDSVTLLVSGNVPVPNSGSPAEQQVGLGQTVPRKSKGEAGLGASQGCRGPWARGLEMK